MTYPRAPEPRGPVTLEYIPPGDAGVAVTLGTMEAIARKGARSPLLQGLARRIVGSGTPVDGPARLRAWIGSRVGYRDDPPGVEMLTAPEILTARALAGEPSGGDCDDVATLAAALGLAGGYPARFVVASFGPWPYEHVWTELHDGRRWVELDTTRPAQFAPGAGVYRQSETAPMYGTVGAYQSQYTDSYQEDPWYVDAAKWVWGLFGGGNDSKSWQEHYAKQWKGSPCPGAPDPRRAALAAKNDPTGAAYIQGKLRQGNEGWAPSLQEMTVPDYALLWVNAMMGGDDCVSSRFPSLPAEGVAWIEDSTPGWSPGGVPNVDPSWVDRIYETAAASGPEAAEELIRYAANKIAGAVPQEWRDAMEAGVKDYYSSRAAGAVGDIAGKWGPLLLTAGAGFVVYELAKRGRG